MAVEAKTGDLFMFQRIIRVRKTMAVHTSFIFRGKRGQARPLLVTGSTLFVMRPSIIESTCPIFTHPGFIMGTMTAQTVLIFIEIFHLLGAM